MNGVLGTGRLLAPDENTVHEAGYLKLDIAKSMTKLEWKPVYTIDEAIQKTIGWYKEYYSKKKEMKKFSLNLIKKFTQDAEKRF